MVLDADYMISTHVESVNIWNKYFAASLSAQTLAKKRFDVLNFVYNKSYLGKTLAVWVASLEFKVSRSTIWRWLKLVETVDYRNWLPYLLPLNIEIGGGK